MAKDGELMGAADRTKRGKGAHKSADITAMLMGAEVTPNGKQGREREQEAPKKLLVIVKKGLVDCVCFQPLVTTVLL